MLFALDLGDRVVGVTNNCNYPPEALKKEKIGGFFLNLEKIVSLKPDLVVMLEDAQKRDIEKFKAYGLNVYTLNPRTVEEVMDSLLELGKVTGSGEKAREVVAQMRERINKVRGKNRFLWFVLRRPKVMVIVGSNPLVVVGGGTFIGDLVKNAGAENVTERVRGAYPHYSFERLLKDNPEYIIIPRGVVRREEIRSDSRWQSLSAVKNKRVLFIDADIISRPGPRVVEAIEEIAHFINGQKT
jgi:iron complex transport system substrate-binding protein